MPRNLFEDDENLPSEELGRNLFDENDYHPSNMVADNMQRPDLLEYLKDSGVSLARNVVPAVDNAAINIANLIPDAINFAKNMKSSKGSLFSKIPEVDNALKSHDIPTIPKFNYYDQGLIPQAEETAANLLMPGKALYNPIAKVLSKAEEGLTGLTAGAKQKQILEHLGAGQSIDRNRELIAQKIHELGNAKKYQSEINYNKALDKGKNVELEGEKFSIPKEAADRSGTAVNNSLETFNENPTFQNAHNLQSNIASRVADLFDKSNPKYDTDAARALQQLRNNVVDRIYYNLNEKAPKAADLYKKATKYHRNEVVPYTTHPLFRKLVNGIDEGEKDVNLTTLPNVFSKQSSKINKVASDLGQDFKNRLIFNKVGTQAANKSNILKGKLGADSLVSALDKAINEQGLARYSSPEISRMRNELQSRARLQKLLGSALLGTGIGTSGLGLHHYLYDLLGK